MIQQHLIIAMQPRSHKAASYCEGPHLKGSVK